MDLDEVLTYSQIPGITNWTSFLMAMCYGSKSHQLTLEAAHRMRRLALNVLTPTSMAILPEEIRDFEALRNFFHISYGLQQIDRQIKRIANASCVRRSLEIRVRDIKKKPQAFSKSHLRNHENRFPKRRSLRLNSLR